MKKPSHKRIAKGAKAMALAAALNGPFIHPSFLAPTEEQREDRMPKEFKLVAIRELGPLTQCDTPELVHDYWQRNIATSALYLPGQENFYALMLTTRRSAIGHYLVGLGTLDTLLVHPREVFRVAIVAGASSIVVMHNHPSGNPMPSESDEKATKDLMRAGQLLGIDLLDHIIIGQHGYKSLHALGHFRL